MPPGLPAQGNGTTAGILLELPPTPRAAGFAGAYAAVVGDVGSVFVNPAGMAPIRHAALGVSVDQGLLGARMGSAAGALRVGRFTLGFGAMYLDYGGDSVIVPDPAFGGDRGIATGALITAYNALGVGAVAYRRGIFSFGANVKALREYVGDGSPTAYTAEGLTGNVGLAMAFFDIAAFGVVAENVGGRLTSGGQRLPLPRTMRVGFTLNFVDPQGTGRFLTTFDHVAPPGDDGYWAIGAEGGFVSAGAGILGRLGLATGRAPSDRGPITVGGTLVVRAVHLDYTYQEYRTAGSGTHRFGVRWVL